MLWLRGLVIISGLSILIAPKKGAWAWIQIVLWEFALALTLPFFQTYLYFHNNGDEYWVSSILFGGLFLGLLSKPIYFVFSMVGATSLATWMAWMAYDISSELVAQSLQPQSLAMLAGLMGCVVQWSMENSHRKTIRIEIAEANQRQLQESLDLLRKRDEIIKVFVRPSLIEEINAGKDPTKFDPIIRNLAILFCDIRDFTSLTEILNPYEKQTFLNQYFTMMTHPIVENGGEVDKIMGDCVMGIFNDGDSATRAAVDMRLALQTFNQKMFVRGQPKIRNGIGIAKGEVMLGNFGSYEKLDRTVIGEAVNIASRLESKTKMYNLEVVVTEDVINDLRPGTQHFRWIDVVQVKGSTRHLKLYEIYGHQPEDVRKYKDDTREMLEKALTIYFQKGFRDAQRLFRAMLAAVPPHRHIPSQLMDTLLRYYIDHCDAWINDPNGAWEKVEKWDGVHVFHEK
ncbi:MAG TPA: adenylate/guanylate cyclase domain-containing protein [Fibrobacteria bacterium]|nr:adenylate/guanylate cyclase domain-containing protein [Fibrobacteria bacterium]